MSLEVALVEREELPKLYRFRHSVFFDELGASLSQDQIDRAYMTDALDEGAFNYALFDGAEIVGSLRFADLHRTAAREELTRKYSLGPILERFGAPGIAIIGRLALAPRVRSGVALTRLITRGLEDARTRGIKVGVSDCSPYLLPFEERLGYRRYAAPFDDPVYGLKLPILLLGEGTAYLSAIRSPIARVAARFDRDNTVEDWFRTTYPEFAAVVGPPRSESLWRAKVAEILSGAHVEKCSLLAGLNPDEVELLLDGAVQLSVEAGHYLIRKGMKEDHFYLMLEGVADAVDATGRLLGQFGAGEVVGEMAFLTSSARSSDVRVSESARCLLISPRAFCHAKRPQLYGKVMGNIARALALRLKAA